MSQISRALLIRSHSLALLFTDKLFDAFSDEVIGWDVARALGNVAAVDDVLTKQHHAVFKVCRKSPLCLKWILTSILATVCPKICQSRSSKNHRVCKKFQWWVGLVSHLFNQTYYGIRITTSNGIIGCANFIDQISPESNISARTPGSTSQCLGSLHPKLRISLAHSLAPSGT